MDLTDFKTIKYLLQKRGLAPQRRFGQNFLIDREALDKITAAADLRPDDIVLEIGPGLGVLTRELCRRAKKVVAVEFDERMLEILRETTMEDCRNLEIVNEDILKFQPTAYKLQATSYKLVANLPYNITSAVLRKFLSGEPRPREMVVLVQKEVAERIVAAPGEMSLLAVSVQFYGRPAIVDYVFKKSFWPEPEVDSAILKISAIGRGISARLSAAEEVNFFRLVKIGFAARRKQLQNNLAAGLKLENQAVREIIVGAGLDAKVRAQDLGLEDWLKLAANSNLSP